MRKLRKLARDPKKFYRDARRIREIKKSCKQFEGFFNNVIALGVNEHQQIYFDKFFPEKNIIFLPVDVFKKFRKYFLSRRVSPNFVVSWGHRANEDLEAFVRSKDIEFIRCEDGYLHSVSSNSRRLPPISVCFDKTGIYYNSRKPSDLETLLNTYDFNNDKKIETTAKKYLQVIKDTGLSKYNNPENAEVSGYGLKTKRRVLIIGQVARDASIVYGCEKKYSYQDIIDLVYSENPEAEIIYRPHPYVLRDKPTHADEINTHNGAVKIVSNSVSLKASLDGVDHVYTISSLAGFEALVRGVKVTCLGAPFYSGWGLTDDRQKVARRTRKLTIEQVFACAYILYPKYYDINSFKEVSLGDAVESMVKQLNEVKAISSEPIKKVAK